MVINESEERKVQNRREVCAECKYIQRPFRNDLNDTVYCNKMLKFIELINSNSCAFWERWQGM
jgi:hypothetical protein